MRETPVRSDALARAGELPPFKALRAFEAAVTLGGFRAAARHLGVHHSVVSRHVAQLEAWLGISLGDRSTGSFVLTAEGTRFHAKISAAISAIALAADEAMGWDRSEYLRVWCSPGLSIQWLAGRIAEFEATRSPFHIELKPSERPANLHAHEADVNIYFHLDGDLSDAGNSELKSCDLARPVGTIAASPKLASKLPLIRSAQDLLAMPLLHGSHRDDWRLWFALNGVVVSGDLAGELCWHPNMALEAARLGRGILLANRFFFERDFARGDLVELDVPNVTRVSFGRYTFVAREDRWSRPITVALRSYLSTCMKQLEQTAY